MLSVGRGKALWGCQPGVEASVSEPQCVQERAGGEAGDESRGLKPGILTPLRVKPDWEAQQEVTPVTGSHGSLAQVEEGLMVPCWVCLGMDLLKVENILMVAKGIRGGGISWEIGIDKHTTIHKIDT